MRDPSSRVAVTKLFYRRDIPASSLAKERPGYALDIAIPINQADGEREREREAVPRARTAERRNAVSATRSRLVYIRIHPTAEVDDLVDGLLTPTRTTVQRRSYALVL